MGVWEARDSALLLQETLRSSAFDVQFDKVQKRWFIATSDDRALCDDIGAPLINHFRINDAWHEVPSNLPNSGGLPHEQDPGEHPFFLHEAPETIQNLFNEFLNNGLVDGPRLSEAIHVRSWYLHHVHHRHGYTSRVLELDGHWSTWARDLADGWRDLVRPDEDLVFFLCHPDPPRSVGIAQELFFDMILVQGTDFPAYAGLITVIRADDTAARAEFALAASLPRYVSGQHIAAQADQIQQCHLRGCRIRQGRTVLPFNYDPVHEMTNGDSFLIEPERRRPAAQAIPSGQTANQQLDYEIDFQEEDIHNDDENLPDRASEGGSQSSAGTWSQAAHIYRLGHLAIFGHLDWNSYHTALRDAIQLARIPRNLCVGFHYVQVRLPDHHEGEEAIILQHIEDIATGSLEKLVVIDIVFHTNSLTRGIPDNPTTVREVYKVQPMMARSHLLALTRVDAYCTWRQNQCIVRLNDHIWAPDDHRLIPIEHGAFLQIQLPPPSNPDWNIGQAVRIIQETGDLLDFPEAGLLATSILDGNIDNNRRAFGDGFIEGARLVTCKSNEDNADITEDIDIPMMLPPGTRLRRPRPLHDGAFDWLDDLVAIFRQEAEAETVEGSPFLYAQTWYIHHQRFRRCPHPRAVRLDGAIIGWLEELRHTWHDILDRSIPFAVYVVKPRPPQSRWQSFSCHILLVQAPQRNLAAGVVTTLFEGPDRDAIMQVAASLPDLVNKPTIIESMQLQPQCDVRRCSATLGGMPIHLIQFSELPNGFNVCVRVASAVPDLQRPICPGEEADHFEHFEDVNFMQRSLSTPASASSSMTPNTQCPTAGYTGAAVPSNLNPQAPAFVPGRVLIEGMDEFTQDLHRLWLDESFSWEGETPTCLFTTWLVDHSGAFRHCTRPRNVRLGSDFTAWEAQIRNLWIDELVGQPILEYHLVSPNPPRRENNVAGHIIVIQHADETMVTSLVSVIDTTLRSQHGRIQRMAVTTHEHIYLETLLDVVGYAQACLPENSPKVCRAWYHDERMLVQRPLPGRSGYGIIINVHLRTRPGRMATNLLQLSATLSSGPTSNPDGERLTQGQVAHTPGPPRIQIQLEQLLQEEDHHDRRPLRLIKGHDEVSPLPTFIDVETPVMRESVQHELRCFGHDCDVWLLGAGTLAICFPSEWEHKCIDEKMTHFVFVEMNGDEASIDPVHYLHSDDSLKIDDNIGLMRFLHQLGHEKAVILTTIQHCNHLIEVRFTVSLGTMEAKATAAPKPSTWPSRQPVGPTCKMYDPTMAVQGHFDCLLDLGANSDQLLSFFEHSSYGDLCQLTDEIDLPEITIEAIGSLQQLERFDRLIIYTDGSSHSSNLRLAPELIEERSVPDAWSFVVLGEQYTDDGSSLALLGWKAHQVRCSPDSPWHLGSRAVGAWVAEREALTWAFIWWLGLNSCIPTIFRSDSAMTIGQSQGSLGSQQLDETFELLRGCHQLLEAALPTDCLRVEHVYGHNSDPWNEFADHLAKREANHGFLLPRGDLDVQFWRPVLPYMWMLFGQKHGMPTHCDQGFIIPTPALPAALVPQPTAPTDDIEAARFTLSFATANVLSLCQRPDGYPGKVNYLREQFISHGLNFLGLQETRSTPGASLVHHVYRLCSGGKNGHHGVELWCNLKQPYCHVKGKPQFFQKSDFAVVYHDDTRLLTKIDSSLLQLWILVLHAPQSGQPQRARECWWETTSNLLFAHQVHSELLFVCADTNAAPGEGDGRHVLGQGHEASCSTPLLRQFLSTFDLCLPSTSDIHDGPRHTWTRPDGSASHLIDYVMVPAAHFQSCVHSQLLEHFDLANQCFDHTATGVELSWSTNVLRRAGAKTEDARCVDRNKIKDSNLNQPLSDFQVACWATDVETQTNALTNHIHHTLQTCCKRDPARPKKEYVSAFAWELRRQKLFHRKQVKTARALLMRESLARIFQAWKGAEHGVCQQSFDFGTTLRCGLFKHFVGLRVTSWGLKKHLEKDRAFKISEVGF